MAIAVIEIGIFSVWSLFLVNFNAEHEAEMRIVGVNLAREGVEAVKNIRDSNWLKNGANMLLDKDDPGSIWPWDENLSAGTYAVNYDSAVPDDARFSQLYLNSGGFYNDLAVGQATPYSRLVTLNDICCVDNGNFQCADTNYSVVGVRGDCSLKIGINIVSDVSWQIGGQTRHAIVEDNIYNWKQ